MISYEEYAAQDRPDCRRMETRRCPLMTACPEGACARFESDDTAVWENLPLPPGWEQ